MKLSIGIVGLPNVGKSTLFNALTKQSVDAANYPFCTIDPSVGLVPVPDERLHKLSELSKSDETIPAIVEFVDIAGLVEGASSGEGLGNKFLSNIREVTAIAEVVRIFEDTDITHVHNEVDPLHDINVINLELVLADLERASSRLKRVEKDAKSGDKEAVIEHNTLSKILPSLEEGKFAGTVELLPEEEKSIKSLGLLTRKKILYVLNTKDNQPIPEALKKFLDENNASHVVVNARVEEEMKDIDVSEKETFRKELGGEGSELDELITKSYEMLGLMTYFTTGEKETRAWTVARGSTAPEAGAAIHSDFKEKFIRASVISYEDLLTAGSMAKAREQGLLRTEGKEYIVKDGDVIEFKI